MSKLRELRVAAGISQAELAEQAHTTQASIHRWENGDRRISTAVAEKLAKALDCEPATLLDWPVAVPRAPELQRIIATTFADGHTIEIRSNRPMSGATWSRIQALLAPHAPEKADDR